MPPKESKRTRLKNRIVDPIRHVFRSANSSSPLPAVESVVPILEIQEAGRSEGEVAIPAIEAQNSTTTSTIYGGETTESEISSNQAKSFTNTKLATTTLASQGVKQILTILVAAGDVFPPLKAAAAALNRVWDIVDMIGDNREDSSLLKKQFESLLLILKRYHDAQLPSELQDCLSGLSRALEERANSLNDIATRNWASGAAMSDKDRQDINRIVREITFSIEIATLHVALDGQSTLSKVKDQLAQLVDGGQLGKLGHVVAAEFNKEDRAGCMQGTRVSLLADLITWAVEEQSHRVFWLNGIAGTGKTTLSETFCTMLFHKTLLGASFFCSIKDKSRSNVRAIFPSLAKAFAIADPKYGRRLVEILEACSDPLGMNLEDQFRTLLLAPVKTYPIDNKRIIFVVDALDECDDKHAIQMFLDVILNNMSDSQFPFKFFLTSRPEPSIRPAFEESDHLSLRLHDIDENVIKEDITIFVGNRLGGIKLLRRVYPPGEWPPTQEISGIVRQAGKLFIFASTVCEHIADLTGDPYERLQSIASATSSVALGPDSDRIDNLYTMILSAAFQRLKQPEITRIQACLSLLISARQTLSVSTYSALLNIPVRQIYTAFTALHSVVRVPDFDHDEEKISIYHASFSDYLTGHARTNAQPWFVDQLSAHFDSAKQCVKLMESQLCMGISGAQTSFKSNADQPVPLSIPNPLAYACTSWVDHILLSTPGIEVDLDNELLKVVDRFLRKHFLHWLEVISGLSQVNENLKMMFRLVQRIPTNNVMVASLLRSFLKFATSFLEPIRTSIPHIYLSALHFSTPNSLVYQLFLPASPRITLESPSPLKTIYNELLRLEGHTGSISVVTYSRDGRLVASASSDDTIRFWDAQTGEPLSNPIRTNDYKRIISMQFSFSGNYLVATDWGYACMIWHVETRQIHQAAVNFITRESCLYRHITFLPDDQVLLDVTKNKPPQLRYFNMQYDAQTELKHIQEGYDSICSPQNFEFVAFSPDGAYLASGAKDSLDVFLWDIQDETIKYQFLLNKESHAAHPVDLLPMSNTFVHLEFSPDGRLLIVSGLVSGSVRVWSTETGQIVYSSMTLDRFCGAVCISLSSSNRYAIIARNFDPMFYLWDTTSVIPGGQPVQMIGHTSGVNSVCFSPDGRYVISGSDDNSIRFWDVEGAAIDKWTNNDPPWSSHQCDFALFLPSSKTMIFIPSNQTTIHFVNTESSTAFKSIPIPSVSSPDNGSRKIRIHSFLLSPTGNSIVVGYEDGATQIWNADDGQLSSTSLGVQQGADQFQSSAFSSDGQHIIMLSRKDVSEFHYKAFKTYNTSDLPIVVADLTLLRPDPTDSNQQNFRFSHNNELLACAPILGSLSVWDTRTWERIFTLDSGHRRRSPDFKFSIDGKLISQVFPDTREIIQYDLESKGTAISQLVVGEGLFSLAKAEFSPDLKYLATIRYEGYEAASHLQFWNSRTGLLVSSIPIDTSSNAWLAFSEDGKSLTTILRRNGAPNAIQVWGLEDFENAPSPLQEDFNTMMTAHCISKGRHCYLHYLPAGAAALLVGADGWLRDCVGNLVLWVPAHLRLGLYLPGMHTVVSGARPLKVKFSNDLALGQGWKKP